MQKWSFTDGHMCYDGYMQTEFLIMLTDIFACMQDAYDAHTQCNVRLVTSLSGRYGYADSHLPKLQLFTDLALPTLNSGQFMIIFIVHRTFPESCYVRYAFYAFSNFVSCRTRFCVDINGNWPLPTSLCALNFTEICLHLWKWRPVFWTFLPHYRPSLCNPRP